MRGESPPGLWNLGMTGRREAAGSHFRPASVELGPRPVAVHL